MGLREQLEGLCGSNCPNDCTSKRDRFEGARIALEDVLAEIERDDPYMKLGAARIRQRLAQLG